MNAIAAMIEEVYTSVTGVNGVTYAWYLDETGVHLTKSEWTMVDVVYITRWGFSNMAEFNLFLEGQHEMHLANGWTHEVFS